MSAPDVVPCPACSAPTFIVMSEGGNRLRLEPGRRPNGTVLPVTLPDGTERARVLGGGDLPAEGGAFVDHRKTCGKQAAGRPVRCAACRGPMDPWLVERGEAYHVNCRPMTASEMRAATEPSSPAVVAGEGRPAGDEPTLDLGEAP